MLLAPLVIVFRALIPVPTPTSYAAFVYTGLLPWLFFSESVRTATESLVVNAPLVRRTAFARSLLPLATVATRAVEHVLVGLITLPVLYATSRHALHATVLLLPVLFALLCALAAGISLCTSVLFVYFRDVRHALYVFLAVWMYATPILYAPTMLPERIQRVLFLNPLTWFLDAGRGVLLEGRAPPLQTWAVLISCAVASLAGGVLIFRRLEKNVADVI